MIFSIIEQPYIDMANEQEHLFWHHRQKHLQSESAANSNDLTTSHAIGTSLALTQRQTTKQTDTDRLHRAGHY